MFDWSALVPSLIGGIVGSIVSPYIHWRIEKRREMIRGRRERIAEMRGVLAEAKTFEDVAYSSTWTLLSKRFSEEEHKSFFSRWAMMGGGVAGGDGERAKLRMLLKEVDKLEQEWDLL